MDETADISAVLKGKAAELRLGSAQENAASSNDVENISKALTGAVVETPGTALVETPPSALAEFPITDKADKVNPPLTLEQKKKMWTRRIVGAILFFAILGSLALLAAAQAVTYLFKTILTP